MYPNYFQSQVADIPDNQYIGEVMIDEIKRNAGRSVICDYAMQILSENHYRNQAVDKIISLPIDTLTTIRDNPTQTPVEQRYEAALRDWALVAALSVVEHDKEFMRGAAEVKDGETIATIKGILGNIQETLRQSRTLSNNVSHGGYKSGITDSLSTSNVRARTPIRSEKEETPQYEPREEKQPKKTRPLLRRKGKNMSDSTLAYRDHATFNRLALMTNAAKPEADFYAMLTDPTGTIDGNYLHSKVDSIVGSSHAHAITTGWCATMASESSCNRTNTILDVCFQTVEVVHLFETPEERELALTDMGELQELFSGNCKSIDQLHGYLVYLHKKAETSPFASALLTALNRRATIAVNKMIRYSLAIENQSIDDFLGDWKDLVNYLVKEFNRSAVESELSKWGPHLARRVSALVVPEKDDEYSGIYEPDILLRSVCFTSEHFTTVLPISAGALGIRLDARTSFVSPAETPVEYKYMKAIQDRANDELSLGLYDSVNIVTSDDVRLQIDSTDIKASDARVAADKYLALTFIDYQ